MFSNNGISYNDSSPYSPTLGFSMQPHTSRSHSSHPPKKPQLHAAQPKEPHAATLIEAPMGMFTRGVPEGTL